MTDISALEAYAGQLSEAAARANAASGKQHVYVHGDDQTDVATESGPVPSLAKQARLSLEITAVLQQRLLRRDAIFVEDFDAVGGDRLASNGDAFRRAVLACLVRGKTRMYGYANFYAFQNDYWETPPGIVFEGSGLDLWDLKGSWRPKKMEGGTTLLFCGTPSTTVTVAGVSKMAVAGGVVANDDYATEGLAGNATYELLDYTNGDSTGAAPATPKQLRVAVRLGANSRLVNCRVQLNYNGVDGYNSVEMLPDFPEYTTSYPGLGDGYDIGVLTYNAMGTGLSNVQVVGYWRMTARAVVASNYGDGKSFGGAVFNDDGILFHGFNGLSVRGMDQHRITAISGTSVEVPWSASHTVPLSGLCYLGGTPAAYTTSTKVGDKLVLTGFTVAPNTLASVGTSCTFGTNQGFSGSSVRNGFICGLNHSTNRRAYDPFLTTPFATPSKAIELSGSPLRDIEFDNVHIMDTDVTVFAHSSLHIGFRGCYAEAQGYAGGIPGQNKGARMIASARPELADAHGAYPAGNCRGFVWDSTSELSDGSVDLYPFIARSSSIRFAGTTRYFCPDNALIEAEGYWAHIEEKRRYDVGTRAFVNGLAGAQYFEIVDDSLYRFLRVNAATDRIGFGVTAPVVNLHRKGANADLMMETTGANDPSMQWKNPTGTWLARPQAASLNQWQLRYNGTTVFQVNPVTGTLFSGLNGSGDIATASNRYNNAFFINSPNVSSDAKLKDLIGDVFEPWILAVRNIKIVRYKMKAAIAEKEAKGEVARWHIGVTAQNVIQAFADQGIDAFEIGVVGKDTWPDIYEEVYAEVEETEQIDVVDEHGQHLKAFQTTKVLKPTGAQRLVRAAGEELSVRYEELLALKVAAIDAILNA